MSSSIQKCSPSSLKLDDTVKTQLDLDQNEKEENCDEQGMTTRNEKIDDKSSIALSDNNDCPSSDEIKNEIKETSLIGIKKKSKPRDPNKRRKIRKMLTMDDLGEGTIKAVKEEEERRKLLLDQRKATVRLLQEKKKKEFGLKDDLNRGQSSSSYFTAPCLTSLLTATSSETKPNSSVICISSDEEESQTYTKKSQETINISSDSSCDDVILLEKDEGIDIDMNNSGLHVDDTKNVHDSEGRVLVNCNHFCDKEKVFLAPQIAKIIRPHQIGGIRFMYDNVVISRTQYDNTEGLGCILAHSMGLGKTLQVIAFIEIFLQHTTATTVLCVVPVNTLMNWVAEFDKWFPPTNHLDDNDEVKPRNFTVHVLRDIHKTIDARSKVVTEWTEKGGVLLLGYEMFRLLTTSRNTRSRKKKKKPKISQPIDVDEEDRKSTLHKGVMSMLLNPGPDLIICDEGHRIKNNGARTSERLKEVKTRRRIVLTGYPMQNNLVEYWCMVDFVRPEYLGSKRQFYNLFERPITNGQGTDSTKEDRKLMRCRSHVLHNLLKGFVQRRSHSVLCHSLPEKKEFVLMVRLSKVQKKLYNAYMRARSNQQEDSSSSASWQSCLNPIRAFSVCCRIWNHPDVLYKTYQEQIDLNADLELELDLEISSKNKQNVKQTNKSLTDSSSKKLLKRKADANIDSGEEQNVFNSPKSMSSIEEKEKENYEWIGNTYKNFQEMDLNQSGKMTILLHLVEKSVSIGDKILIFSQSLSTLSLIESFFSTMIVPKYPGSTDIPKKWKKGRSYLRLDGNTSSSEREKLINQFNDPNSNDLWMFLLSTKAGCLGINLIGANRVIVTDASWNPCYDAQAVCRCYRYGQQKKTYIYRLVADQSMEKKIYERQISKQGMSDRVVDRLNPTQVFTKREVVSLLEFSDKELPTIPCDQLSSDIEDPVLLSLCKTHGNWLTKKPFTHESLLLNCKDQKLTLAQRKEAMKSYQLDKKASSTLNYTRPSYINYYSSTSRAIPAGSGHGNNSSNYKRVTNCNRSISLPTSRPHYKFGCFNGQGRPVASVQPYTTSSNTRRNFNLQSQYTYINANCSKNMIYVTGPHSRSTGNTIVPGQQATSQQAPGSNVKCVKVTATTDIPIPIANTMTISGNNGNLALQTTMSVQSGGSNVGRDRIKAGEEITIMQTRKGTYIRTYDDKIFCVKTNEDSSQHQPLLNVNNVQQQANSSNFSPNIASQNEAISETTGTSFQFTLPSTVAQFTTESNNCKQNDVYHSRQDNILYSHNKETNPTHWSPQQQHFQQQQMYKSNPNDFPKHQFLQSQILQPGFNQSPQQGSLSVDDQLRLQQICLQQQMLIDSYNNKKQQKESAGTSTSLQPHNTENKLN